MEEVVGEEDREEVGEEVSEEVVREKVSAPSVRRSAARHWKASAASWSGSTVCGCSGGRVDGRHPQMFFVFLEIFGKFLQPDFFCLGP